MLVAVAVAVAAVSAAASSVVPRSRDSLRGRRSRWSMPYVLEDLPDTDFRMLYRMEREDFHALLELLRDNISANEDMASLSAGEPIPAECRLAMSLRILAGASYLDCALAFGVGRSTVFGIFDQVCLYTALPLYGLCRVRADTVWPLGQCGCVHGGNDLF